MEPKPARVAIAGVGNCASSLVQGVEYYRQNPLAQGCISPVVGGLRVEDIMFVAAFDVDERKVGRPLSEAIFALPNSAERLVQMGPEPRCIVSMGPALDGIAPHTTAYPIENRILASQKAATDVSSVLAAANAEVLVCYLPVGSEDAVRFYAECALKAGVGFINCVPVFLASDPSFRQRFESAGIPLIGDDVRSQVGATILHQRICELLVERGHGVRKTYQLNVGGNSDFLNMLAKDRLASKRKSKTDAVKSALSKDYSDDNLHVGPSDYVAHLRDTKIAYINFDAAGFMGAAMNIEIKLEVQDSPNSAGVVVDVIRYTVSALREGSPSIFPAVCSYYMKSPPERMSDIDAVTQLRALAHD